MKTIYYSMFLTVSLNSLSAFGQATCPESGGSVPNNCQAPHIHGPAGPYGLPANYLSHRLGQLTTNNNSNLAVSASSAAPTIPVARITVLPADAPPIAHVTPKTPTARLTIVAADAVVSTPTTVAPSPEPKLDDRIAKLVGIWKAVARRGNGELTTIELHLDNRGWAELTVPGSDGNRNTSKARVDFENDELKLKGDDNVVSLGKLVESTSRQMVLERAEGRVTFVRL